MQTIVLEEAAELLHINAEVLRRKAKSGLIPGKKIGKRWVFVKEHLIEWISKPVDIVDNNINPIKINKSLLEKNTCHSTDETKSGTFRLQPQVEKEYKDLLSLQTRKTRSNCTIN